MRLYVLDDNTRVASAIANDLKTLLQHQAEKIEIILPGEDWWEGLGTPSADSGFDGGSRQARRWVQTFQSDNTAGTRFEGSGRPLQDRTSRSLVAINVNLAPEGSGIRRSERWGLEVLKWLRADYRNAFHAVLFTFESRNSLSEFGRCASREAWKLLQNKCDPSKPKRIEFATFHLHLRLSDTWAPVHPKFPTKQQRKKMAIEVLRGELGVYHRAYRHDYKTLLAAIRLLLGAMQARDVPLEEGIQLLGQLEEEAQRISDRTVGPKSPYDRQTLELWLSAWEHQEMALGFQRVLLIDDNAEIKIQDSASPEGATQQQGWKDVLQAILNGVALNECEVITAKDWQEVEDRNLLPSVNQVAARKLFDFVLLDHDLGPEAKKGTEVLPEIKIRQPDLPVIMMTAFDDYKVVRDALRAGADDFYVKELGDPDDRDSLHYYLKFREVLSKIRPISDGYRFYRRRFAEIESALTRWDTEPRWTGSAMNPISSYVKLAFQLLGMDLEEGLSPEKKGSIVASLYHAAETAADRVLQDCRMFTDDFRVSLKGKRSLIKRRPKSKSKIQDSPPPLTRLCKLGPDAIHGRRLHLTKSQLIDFFREALDFLSWHLSALPLAKASHGTKDQVVRPVRIEGVRNGAAGRGVLLCNIKPTLNRSERSSLRQACQLRSLDVGLLRYKEREKALENFPQVAFLDFDSCEVELGLNLISKLRARRLGMPLVVVSSRQDARGWRRIHSRGADFILVKTGTRLSISKPDAATLCAFIERTRHFRTEEYWQLLLSFERSTLLQSELNLWLANQWGLEISQLMDAGTLIHTQACGHLREAFYHYLQVAKQLSDSNGIREFYLAVRSSLEQLVQAATIAREGKRGDNLRDMIIKLANQFPDFKKISRQALILAYKRNRALYRPLKLVASSEGLRSDFLIAIDCLVHVESCLYEILLQELVHSPFSRWSAYKEQCAALGLADNQISNVYDWYSKLRVLILEEDEERLETLPKELNAFMKDLENRKAEQEVLMKKWAQWSGELGRRAAFPGENRLKELDQEIAGLHSAVDLITSDLKRLEQMGYVAELLRQNEKPTVVRIGEALLQFKSPPTLTRQTIVGEIIAKSPDAWKPIILERVNEA